MRRVRALFWAGARAKVCAFLLCAVLYVAVALGCGMPAQALPLSLVCAAGYLVLPGLFLARLLPKKAVPQALFWPAVLLLGTGFLCLCYLLAMRLWRPLLNVVPPVLAVAALAQQGRQWFAKRKSGQPLGRPGADWPNWLLLLGVAFVGCAFAGVAMGALPSAVGATRIEQDLLWNTGNAAALTRRFLPLEPRFTGIRLQYHFFTDLLCAIFSMVTGLDCYTIYLFCLQPLLLAGVVLAVRGMGLAVFGGSRGRAFACGLILFGAASAALAGPLVAGGDFFGNNFIVHLVTNINAQTTTTLWFAVFFGFFAVAFRQGAKAGFWPLALAVGGFFALCLTKGPVAGIVVCAVVLGLLCSLPAGRCGWRGLAFGAALAACFAGCYVLLYSGGAESALWLQPGGTLLQTGFAPAAAALQNAPAALAGAGLLLLCLLQAVLMLPLPAWLALLGFAGNIRRLFSLGPVWLACFFGAGGGMLAYFLFNHQSYSQVYFFFAAVLFLCPLAVWQLPRFAPGLFGARQRQGDAANEKTAPKPVRVATAVVAAVSLVTALCTYGGFVLRGVGHLAAPAAGAEEVALVSPADEAAARWMRQNTPQDAIFATNRISSGASYEGISNLYSALGERQAYMEGFRYVQSNMGIPWQVLQQHVEVNAALFDPATPPEEVAALAAQNGIGYLIYHALSEGDDAHLAGFEKVFDGGTTVIYRL